LKTLHAVRAKTTEKHCMQYVRKLLKNTAWSTCENYWKHYMK
jgi:hypothetical protein